MTIEEAAAFAHERWCTWMHWMDAHWNDTHASGELFLDRWHRQSETPYDELSEAEKDSDRNEAAAWMNALGVGQLRAEVARLREALELYANPKNWEHDSENMNPSGPPAWMDLPSAIDHDNGATARTALEVRQ